MAVVLVLVFRLQVVRIQVHPLQLQGAVAVRQGGEVPADARAAKRLRRALYGVALEARTAAQQVDLAVVGVAGPGAVQAGIPVIIQAVVQAQFGAVMTGFGAADIVAIGVLENHVVLVHEIDRQVVLQLLAPGAAQAQFDITELFRVQVGLRLARLQPIQFRGLGRAKAVGQAQVYEGVHRHAVTGAGVGAPVGVVVIAVGGAVETAGTGGGPAGGAVTGPVVVIVIGVLQAQARAQFPVIAKAGPPLAESGRHRCAYRVIIVDSRRLVGREIVPLVFLQVTFGVLEFKAGGPAAVGQVSIERCAQPQAALVIFFHRLPGYEVLQELHLVVAQVGRDGQGIAVIEGAAERGMEPQRAGIAVGLGIGIVAPDAGVLVRLVTGQVTGRLLVEVGKVQDGAGAPLLTFEIIAQGGFLLVVARVIEVAAVRGAIDAHAHPVCAKGIAVTVFGAVVIPGARLHGDILVHLVAGRGAQYIDQAVHGVGAVERSGRPLDHLDASGLFGIGVEQLVDVAKTGRPQADAVTRDQEGATAARPGQYR